MKKSKKVILTISLIIVVLISAIFIIESNIIGAIMFAVAPENEYWYKTLDIDTNVEFTYPIEHTEDGFSVNGKEFIQAKDYNYEAVKHLRAFEQPNVDAYYIEDSYLGCYDSGYLKAAFGTSADNVDFILFFGDRPIRKYKWYVAEDYVLPSITKDEVSSLLIMNKDSMKVTYESSAYDRVRQSEAVAKITDRKVIDDVVKNKNYDLLNEYTENKKQYVVMAQFDGHIIYETITVLNDTET